MASERTRVSLAIRRLLEWDLIIFEKGGAQVPVSSGQLSDMMSSWTSSDEALDEFVVRRLSERAKEVLNSEERKEPTLRP